MAILLTENKSDTSQMYAENGVINNVEVAADSK